MEPLIARVPPGDYQATPLELWAANEILVNHQRIKAALDRASNIDGAHHKQWIIDQMVRILAGDGYEEWVKQYESCGYSECSRHEDGDDEDLYCDGGYSWDKGIAP
jgi:hypothetical protein